MTLSAEHPPPAFSDMLGAAPSHIALLSSFIELKGDLTALCAHHPLSGLQLLDFLQDPFIAPLLHKIDSILSRSIVKRFNTHAGEALISSIDNTQDPVERRRSATVLARIARYYDGTSPPPPRGGGGRVREAGGGVSVPDGPDSTALQSSASPSDNPSHTPSDTPLQTPTPTPSSDPNPPQYSAQTILLRLLTQLKDPITAALDTAQPLFGLARGIMLDHTPITREVLDDPERLTDLLQNSTLGDVFARDYQIQPDPILTDTAATFQVFYPSTPDLPDPFTVTIHFTRNSASWLLTSISSTTRPAPTPCASSP